MIIPNRTKTGDNDIYVRYFWETKKDQIGPNKKWIKYSMGEGSIYWLGYENRIILWDEKTRNYFKENSNCRITDDEFWFKKGITYSAIKAKHFAFRYLVGNAV